MAREQNLTGVERTFPMDEIVVTKTDKTGRISYANDVFIDLSGYEEQELIGSQHSLIRHPHMPRVIFKLLWQTIEESREIFAYVVNRAKNGDHYWVFAHVTPSLDTRGAVIGYHSNRRVARPQGLTRIKPIYESLLAEERRHADRKEGLRASMAMLEGTVRQHGFDGYDRFVLALAS